MADITVSWSGSVSGHYEVQYKKSSDTVWSVPSGSPVTGLSLALTGLDANTAYIFRVRSLCGTDVSPWQYQSYTTPTVGCAAITSLSLSAQSNTTVTVSFTASGDSLNGYIIEYKASSSLTWLSSATFIASPYTIAGLSPGTAYDFRVVTLCAGDATSTSGVVTTSTTASYAGCAAIGVGSLATAVEGTHYKATWANTGGTPSGHTFRYSINGGGTWAALSSSIIAQTLTQITYQLPPSVLLFPKTHLLEVTPVCFDASTGTPAQVTYTSPDVPTQYVIFRNNLSAGSVTSVSIDGSPNVLLAPIVAGASLNYNQSGLFAAHFITGILSSIASGTHLLVEHVRSASVIDSGTVVYGTNFTFCNSWTLADQDILRVSKIILPHVTVLTAVTGPCSGSGINNYLGWTITLSGNVAVNTNYTLGITYAGPSFSSLTFVNGTITAGTLTQTVTCPDGPQLGLTDFTIVSVCILAMDAGVDTSGFTC